jgi:hypothetical protein
MEPHAAGAILERTVADPRAPMTVADAAAKSGLALRDAEQGLHWLTERYRGHLRVTADGDLVFVFPTGFTRPWATRDALSRALGALGRALAGAGRFVVRAWLAVVLVGYALAFVAILIGLMFARSDNDSGSSRRGIGGGELLAGLFRVLADALFWTFHPFSPLAVGTFGAGWGGGNVGRPVRPAEERDASPFYEKVNRFVFGPTAPREDPRELSRRLVAAIRAGKGRIGVADVMRVTGLPREKADPLMARLMLDYDGEVDVSEEGGITYRFEALRRSAREDAAAGAMPGTARPAASAPRAAWDVAPKLGPLTGNPAGSNVLIAAVNGFNLVLSAYAIGAGLTLANITELFQGVPLEKLPADGVPVALGLIPLVFSLLIFLLPIGRAIARPIKARGAAREQGRLAVLRAVLARVRGRQGLDEDALRAAYREAAGREPAPQELTRVVVDLGGDVERPESGEVRYRFPDLEREAEALAEAREGASEREAKPARVVFTTED